MGIDRLCSLAILACLASAALVYARRCRSPFVRVERDGGSPLLSRSTMNVGYWALQPLGAYLVHLRVSPDAITLGSLALSMASAGFVVAGHLGVAALLGAVSACGDALDGWWREQRTRRRRRGSFSMQPSIGTRSSC